MPFLEFSQYFCSMSQITFKKATITDLIQLKEISISTFTETYASLNTEENMALYINESLSKTRLSSELENVHSEFYLAYLEFIIIGYLKVNFPLAHSEKIGNDSLEIERIYIQKSFQGKGYGSMLIQKAIEIAKSKNFNKIWLGVWSKNKKAIRFYENMGFTEFDQHIFKLGDDEQLDLLLELNIP